MEDVTLGIKTLLRPDSLKKLLTSIQTYYPGINIVVVDDGKTPSLTDAEASQYPNLNYLKVAFDVGIGGGRNIMIDAIETPYTVYLDDDFVFNDSTDLTKFREILEQDVADIVGGGCTEKGRTRRYHGKLVIEGDVLHYVSGNLGEGHVLSQITNEKISYEHVDILLQFFMGKTAVLKKLKWDSELKICTHTEFFIRACKECRIAYCPDVWVHHAQTRHPEYNSFRNRNDRAESLRKHGITSCKFHGKWGLV